MTLSREAVVHIPRVLLITCTYLFFVNSAHIELPNVQSDNSKVQPTIEDYNPQQIHITFGESVHDIVIMWATKVDDESLVELRIFNQEDSLRKVEGKTLKFSGNSKGLKFLHRVVLNNLVYDTNYFYNVGGKIDTHRSQMFKFRTPSLNIPHTYMVYGDLGTETRSLPFLVHEAVGPKNYTAIFHVGDIAYDLGRDGGQIGDKFLNKIEKMSSQIPYMTVPGDHEYFIDEQYRFRFSNPNADWPMKLNQLWYSMDVGKTHFVCISTEVFFSDKGNIETLMKWLNNDLQNANENRSHFPWIIVMTHRPAYCSTESHSSWSSHAADCATDESVIRKNLDNIYVKYGVDVIFAGHEHLYERTWPTANGRSSSHDYINPQAPVHITAGTMGNVYLTEPVRNTAEEWSAFRKSERNLEVYGRLTVYNYTHLLWEALKVSDNTKVDRMLLVQRVHGSFSSEKVFIPDPLGEAGEKWREKNANANDNSFINFNFFLVHDDYNTRVTVLIFTSVILLIGIILRKKIIKFLQYWCMKNENCNNIATK